MRSGVIMSHERLRRNEMTIAEKLWEINWSFVLLITLLACVGFLMLYSAANGNFDPWTSRQMVRFGVGVTAMLVVALIDVRLWMRYAYVFYVLSMVLLVGVELRGTVGMGAQRWIDLGFFQLQPSELVKITMIMALARYFHGAGPEETGSLTYLIVPALMVLAPVGLVLKQPDLGTAMMLLMGAAVLFFMAGVRLWMFVVAGLAGAAAAPVVWQFLHEYQKKRVLTFLNPESDPLGAGYHILQSKIALGSGGVFGKGFLQGSQSHLNFLPEKQTDFIFTMLAEEFGLVGGIGLLSLYAVIILYCLFFVVRARHQFGRLLAVGVTATFFLYVFINIAMVMGLIPVVGVPLPLISYGGTSMLTILIGFGLVLSVHVHRDVTIGRRGAYEDP